MEIGDQVYKDTGDYDYEGVIVTKFAKLHGGHVRYVVENDAGILMIFNDRQIKPVPS